ncbi:Crp/Fnr family transcriptional regulator [Candidatus Methanomassiliicoccus intestinalis]|uniref:Crp/Fnr family transcriptional regulator n=2 Tax=Candidatus Methanomassiliicoccus intestinalis TaxID=1406512 RepID=A0A8J8PBK6_9ARCH|nr:MAG: Crp/Fnr family transcriptional regulator [Candidatus Methanomassiliicoccus intestinalis]
MKKYLHLIRNSPLFSGMTDDEILSILDCMNGTVKRYQKDAVILRSGDIVHNVGIVLNGNVHIVKEDFWENDNILTCLGSGQIFAEAYACLGTERLEINVIAKERTDVLFINVNKIMNVCTSSCEFHSVLIRNLLWSLAEKNLVLTKRIEHTSKRSIREKLLSYLSEQSKKARSPEFEIPFNRQQLADYLSVDRSAMSNELSKLRNEGLIDFEKNKFKLSDLSA